MFDLTINYFYIFNLLPLRSITILILYLSSMFLKSLLALPYYWQDCLIMKIYVSILMHFLKVFDRMILSMVCRM